MGGHLLAAVVALLDTALFSGLGHAPAWAVVAYALAATLVVVLRQRRPAAAFVSALTLDALSGGAYLLLLLVAYYAGRTVVSRTGTAIVVGAAAGGLAVQLGQVQLGQVPLDARAVSQQATVYAVFVALPLLAGRYVGQQERERDIIARQERLRERLRIARDMHDSLGRRLSLVSVQAAALEVSALAPAQREAVAQLAVAARSAMEEVYVLIGALRGAEASPLDLASIGELVAGFRAAGVPVDMQTRGAPRAVDGEVAEVAYRVVEEGLTNAAKHAPGKPATVHVEWESDTLLVTVANRLAGEPLSSERTGHGLAGLAERVGLTGGFLDHRLHNGHFRLVAMLPVMPDATPTSRRSIVGIGLAAALLMFVLLPASMLVGAA